MKNPKSNIKLAFGVWGKVIIATLMCGILYLSFSVIGNGLLAKEVGYRVYRTVGEETQLVEEVYYENGINTGDEAAQELASDEQLLPIKEISNATKVGLDIVMSLCMLFIFGIFPYNSLWDLGNRDENNVRYKHQSPNPLRGLKIGAMATLPSLLLYILLWLGKMDVIPAVYLPIYRILNVEFLPYINRVLTDASGNMISAFGEISFGKLILIALPLLFVPAICAIAYTIGYRHFSINEFLTYKNTGKNKK